MSTAELPRGVSGPTELGVVLEGVSWETYEKLIEGFGDRRSYTTYDRGTMEIGMSPGRKHERGADVLVSLVSAIRDRKDLPIEAGGSVTHRHPELAKGVEPDACYWIANEAVMRGVDELDLKKHPAPDLVIEIDVAASSIDRIEIFHSLGVPEVWRVSKSGLEFLVRGDQGSYEPHETSSCFPFVDRQRVEQAVREARTLGESAALRQLLIDLKLR